MRLKKVVALRIGKGEIIDREEGRGEERHKHKHLSFIIHQESGEDNTLSIMKILPTGLAVYGFPRH